jgi:putative membrane protein
VNLLLLCLIIFIMIEHFIIMLLEMGAPKSRLVERAFGIKKELMMQKQYETLMKNQGLYNGFLVAGLLASFFLSIKGAMLFQVFFLSCISIAGIFAGVTVRKKIFFIQGLPAIIALILIFCQ